MEKYKANAIKYRYSFYKTVRDHIKSNALPEGKWALLITTEELLL